MGATVKRRSHKCCIERHNYWMAPIYGRHSDGSDVEGMPDTVYASDINQAFKSARCKWPTAEGWRCHGMVAITNPEICNPCEYTGMTERLVRKLERT